MTILHGSSHHARQPACIKIQHIIRLYPCHLSHPSGEFRSPLACYPRFVDHASRYCHDENITCPSSCGRSVTFFLVAHTVCGTDSTHCRVIRINSSSSFSFPLAITSAPNTHSFASLIVTRPMLPGTSHSFTDIYVPVVWV